MRRSRLAPGNRLALAVADARVAGGAIRPYAPTAEDCLHGWFGNRALVNGELDAELSGGAGLGATADPERLQRARACCSGFRDAKRATANA